MSEENIPVLASDELTSDPTEIEATSIPTSQQESQQIVPFYRHPSLLRVLRAVGINFFLPFLNGVMLGLGEIFANEIMFSFGWFGARIIPAGGRSLIPLGLRGTSHFGGGVAAGDERKGGWRPQYDTVLGERPEEERRKAEQYQRSTL
ncbi:uncharacterized protein VTP21DRAFT_6399 [Calcarisporiella thermophila]|uniref:uncharacterized protein n=1 Tax=Calcarisporiella thermophila TaxID=911321 RepID=UPI0037445E83